MTQDEMVGWHHQLKECEFEQALGGGEGQEDLVCCSPWGHKESDTTEQLNNNNTQLMDQGTIGMKALKPDTGWKQLSMVQGSQIFYRH